MRARVPLFESEEARTRGRHRIAAGSRRAAPGRTVRIGSRRVPLLRTLVAGVTATATAAVTALALVPSARALSTNGEFNYA